MNHLLSTGDIEEITGLTRKAIGWAIEVGVVVPVEGGGSSGRHYRFTEQQALGLLVYARIRQTRQGCATSYAAEIVQAFEHVDDQWLEEHFNESGTHFVMVHHGTPLLRSKQGDWVDVKWCRDHVQRKIHQIEKRLAYSFGGRTRGLAGAAKRD